MKYKSLTFIFILLFNYSKSQSLEFTFIDMYTGLAIPMVQIDICNKRFEANEFGMLKVNLAEEICEFSAFAFNFKILNGKIAIKNKNQITLKLEPLEVQLKDFEIIADKINITDGREIVRIALANFEVSHEKIQFPVEIQDSTSYTIGNESFFTTVNDGKFTDQDLFNMKFSQKKTITNLSKYKFLKEMNAQNGAYTIQQKLKEYKINRTDYLLETDCDIYRNIDCYFTTFYSSVRTLRINPYFSNVPKSQEFDHYGYFNEDFLFNHEFKLLSLDTISGRACYLIEILPNRKSPPISIAGQGVSNWYNPTGKIWIDMEDLALTRLHYKYEFKSKSRLFSHKVDKAEYESGKIYFENFLEFKKIGKKFLPVYQFTREKNRNLRIFYTDTFFEPVYVEHYLKFKSPNPQF